MSAAGLMQKNPALVAGVVLGGLALLWLAKSGAKNAGASLATGAVDMVSGVISGGAIGIGSLFGLPQTDAAKGAAAVASGNMLDASLYLPAPQFIAAAVGNTKVNPLQPVGSWIGGTLYDLTHSKANGGMW